MDLARQCAEALSLVRRKRPLVHHITNIVVANDNANTMLALGALPVMAFAREEVEEMVSQAQALVVNLGTLTVDVLSSALQAGKKANTLGIPVVLDPVGAGATPFRTESALFFLECIRVTILRGNAGETKALLGFSSRMRGVESEEEETDRARLAQEAARQFSTVSVVTGAVDFVSDGKRVAAVRNGHPLLTKVTGTGCMATSLCGAFVGAIGEPFLASLAALGFLGVCAEKAASFATNPGSFRVHLLDAMHALEEDEFAAKLRLEVLP
ncbi:hydroxyethylthiazole kinase [Candidatus Caldatribacterium sp.]|uniref:hydroxyethylthiazole kinase n=1 Tax=Candidatus Caldatribacterium sp. TaxID=2282143 RepID=UPI002991A7F1|nr:hydroxyethylthiazole kinase [Candidatus Caldatribacterium sp.]MDW8080411.1 hydroxyethylthiazole kinase [Candidatus Calescibacterium sp.]